MLTIFACPKPFNDPHMAIIQHNAITSWTLLRPKPEIILFGNERGVADICEELGLGLRHVPEIARNEFGTPLLSDLFAKAQHLATCDILCYVNADIILLDDFIEAVKRVVGWGRRFLMVGRRWDLNIREPLNYKQVNWKQELRTLAIRKGEQRPPVWIDYFVFPRGSFRDIPPFTLGRSAWDNWLIWRARSSRIPVVDVSSSVIAIHQNHDYSHHPEGERGVWQGEEAERNRRLAGVLSHLYSIEDANYRLEPSGIRRNMSLQYVARRLEIAKRVVIDHTRPFRHAIGLRRARAKASRRSL